MPCMPCLDLLNVWFAINCTVSPSEFLMLTVYVIAAVSEALDMALALATKASRPSTEMRPAVIFKASALAIFPCH